MFSRNGITPRAMVKRAEMIGRYGRDTGLRRPKRGKRTDIRPLRIDIVLIETRIS